MKKVLILITAVLLLAAVISCNGENAFRQEDAVCSVGSRHFASVQSAVDYVTSTTSRAVSEENTIRLLKDILGTNTPEAQRGSIIIPQDYSGSLLIDLSGHSYEFAGSAFLSVNGGKDVTVTNGKLIVPSDNSSTGKVLTVSQGELNIKDVIVDDSRPTPLAADVKKNAKLNISATDDKLSSLNGSFTFSLGASMSVNGGTVTFMAIEEPDVKADISLYKGVIKNSHDVNDRITEAVRNPEIERSIVHTPLVKYSAKAATCTEDGVKEHYVCKTCNGYFLDAECTKSTTESETVILKLGHRDGISEVKAKEPTCTESGNPAYFICTYCQMTFGDVEGKTSAPEKLVIDALGHVLNYVAEKASTCTEQGYDAFYGCTRCERYFIDADAKNEIKELNYRPLDPDNHANTSFTKKTDTHHTKKCDDCGKEILTENHNYGDWVANDNETYTLTCKDCDYAITVEHYFEDVKRVEPTCTVNGMKEHAVCKLHKDEIWSEDHDHILSEKERDELVISATDHDLNWTHNGDDHWQYCTKGDYQTEKTKHNMTIVNLKAQGHTKGCNTCGYSIETPEAHNVVWSAVSSKPGVAIGICSAGCGYEISSKDFQEEYHAEFISEICTDKSNHAYYVYSGEIDGTSYTIIFNNERNQVLKEKPEYIKGHSESWDGWFGDEFGHYHKCDDCQVESDPVSHVYGAWTISDEEGVAAERTCSECHYAQKVYDSDLIFHDESESTCTVQGNDAYYSCRIDYETEIFLNSEKSEVINELSWLRDKVQHDSFHVGDKPATCQSYGYLEHYECKNCDSWFSDESCTDKIFKDSVRTEMTKHNYEFSYDNEQHFEICSYCNLKKNKENHQWSKWTVTAPYEAQRICSLKNCIQSTEKAKYEDYQEVASDCTKNGVKSYRLYTELNLRLIGEGTIVVLSDNDLIIPAGHVFSEEWVIGTFEHWHKCLHCNVTTGSEKHVYDNWKYYNADKHEGVCKCGHTKIKNHNYPEESGVCKDCGYQNIK